MWELYGGCGWPASASSSPFSAMQVAIDEPRIFMAGDVLTNSAARCLFDNNILRDVEKGIEGMNAVLQETRVVMEIPFSLEYRISEVGMRSAATLKV